MAGGNEMRLILFVAVVSVLWFATASGQNPPSRGLQVSQEQIAPSTAFFDTVITTTSSTDDSVWFGFYADWFEVIPYGADVVVNMIHDATLAPWNASAGADSTRALQVASSRGAAGSNDLITLNQLVIDPTIHGKLSLPVRVSGVRIQGTATDSCIVLAGGSAYLNTRY
jgi:hypothetical protein